MTPPPWPVAGRCAACTGRAEQYPSGRWRHLDGPCRFRSVSLVHAGSLPMPKATFVPDGEPLPRPDRRFHPVVHYEDGVPTSVSLHVPERVDEFWDEVRKALRGERHT